MQYVRVALVAASAPLIVRYLLVSTATHPAVTAEGPWRLVDRTLPLSGMLTLIVLATAGGWVGRLIRLPSPALLGPMLLTIVATFAGVTHGGFAPVGPLRALLFTSIGLDVGLRFTKKTVRHIRRLFPLVLACTFAVSAVCASLAWVLAQLTHIPFTDAYLATTPGGINAVLATAIATGANVPLISTVQSLRLIGMVLHAPLIIRAVVTSRARSRSAA